MKELKNTLMPGSHMSDPCAAPAASSMSPSSGSVAPCRKFWAAFSVLFALYVAYDYSNGGWDFYFRKPEELPDGSVKRLPGG